MLPNATCMVSGVLKVLHFELCAKLHFIKLLLS